jgi:superfamily II DNA or RNA helicase
LILTKSVKESEVLNELIPESILLNWALENKKLEVNMNLINNAINEDVWFTIVWTIDKIGRGVDIPPIDTLFLFSPVRFRGTVVQAVGRALRKYPGKSDVAIYDWCDLPILKKQQRERLKDYSTEYWIDSKSFKFLQL